MTSSNKPLSGPTYQRRIGFDDDRRTLPAHPGVDDCENDRTGRKPSAVGGKQIGCRLGLCRGQVGKQVDHRNAGCDLVQHGLDLAGIGPFETKIGEQDNYRSHSRLFVINCSTAPATNLKFWT